MDKQILRNFAIKNSWKQKAKDLKAGEKLEVIVPNEIKDSVLKNYEIINSKLNK